MEDEDHTEARGALPPSNAALAGRQARSRFAFSRDSSSLLTTGTLSWREVSLPERTRSAVIATAFRGRDFLGDTTLSSNEGPQLKHPGNSLPSRGSSDQLRAWIVEGSAQRSVCLALTCLTLLDCPHKPTSVGQQRHRCRVFGKCD